MIADGSFEYDSQKNSDFKKERVEDSGVVEKTKRRNHTLTVTKEVHEPRISSENDINRNIFKNADLLKFLEAK